MGILYKKIGDPISAADAFRAVLDKNPNNTEAKLHLSTMYLEKGQKTEALEILEEGNDEVFFSEDEDKEKAPTTLKRKRKEDFKGEKIKKKVKFQENEEKLIILSPKKQVFMEFDEKENFGEMIENRINKIMKEYDVDVLRLKFTQADILIDQGNEEEFVDKVTDYIIISLKLENEIKVIERKQRIKVLIRY